MTTHATMIGYVADALAASYELQDLMVSDNQSLLVQIGDDLQHPAGEDDCPAVVVISLGADSVNGREPGTHRLQIDACFVAGNDDIISEETDENDADSNEWTVRRKTYGSVAKADQIIDAIRDAIYAKLSALAVAKTGTFRLGQVSRDIDSAIQHPLVVATAIVEIVNPNPE